MSEGLKEPRKVLYEDKDVVSAVSYSLSENQDMESANVGDTTDMMERTENGWCIVTGVCIVYFFICCILSMFIVGLLHLSFRNQI